MFDEKINHYLNADIMYTHRDYFPAAAKRRSGLAARALSHRADRQKFLIGFFCALLISYFFLVPSASADSTIPRFSLPQLTQQALAYNRGLAAAGDQVDAARAGIESAKAFPNPQLETLQGRQRARNPGTEEGTTREVWITQTVDYPWIRSARIEAASAGLEAAEAGRKLSQNELVARLHYRFYEWLRQEAELKSSLEDESTLEQIAGRIRQRVELGEAPRFESIKADTELLNARKSVKAAGLRLQQTRAALRQLVGPELPAVFRLDGNLEVQPRIPNLETLKAELLAQNPELERQRALTRQAESQLDQERRQRWPSLAIKGGYDQTPETRDSRVGLVMTLPIWDWRGGPIGEARARLSKVRNETSEREFALLSELEGAWQQHQIASGQVNALETGIVKQAEAALKVAEAAYRFGERGILEYLDAQRVYRAARNELITARFDLHVSAIEIERLRAPQGSAE